MSSKACSSIIKNNELGYALRDYCYNNPFGKAGHKEKHVEKNKHFVEILKEVRQKNINRHITK